LCKQQVQNGGKAAKIGAKPGEFGAFMKAIEKTGSNEPNLCYPGYRKRTGNVERAIVRPPRREQFEVLQP
jgi:hypothetical protein